MRQLSTQRLDKISHLLGQKTDKYRRRGGDSWTPSERPEIPWVHGGCCLLQIVSCLVHGLPGLAPAYLDATLPWSLSCSRIMSTSAMRHSAAVGVALPLSATATPWCRVQVCGCWYMTGIRLLQMGEVEVRCGGTQRRVRATARTATCPTEQLITTPADRYGTLCRGHMLALQNQKPVFLYCAAFNQAPHKVKRVGFLFSLIGGLSLKEFSFDHLSLLNFLCP